jgi:hypothetical protein
MAGPDDSEGGDGSSSDVNKGVFMVKEVAKGRCALLSLFCTVQYWLLIASCFDDNLRFGAAAQNSEPWNLFAS